MQFSTSGAQQGTVGGVLNEGVLEKIRGLRRQSPTKQEARLGQLRETGLQLRLRALRHMLDQVVAELAPQQRADLRDFLCGRTETIEPRHQRGVQRGGYVQRRRSSS